MDYIDCCPSLEVSLPGCQRASAFGEVEVGILPFSPMRNPGRPRIKKKLSSLNQLVSASVGCKRKLDSLAVGQSSVESESGEQGSPGCQGSASESISSQGSGSVELGGGISGALERSSYAVVYSRKVKAPKGLFDYNVRPMMSEEAGYQTLLLPISVEVVMEVPQSSEDSNRKRPASEHLLEDDGSPFSSEEPECKRSKMNVELPGNAEAVSLEVLPSAKGQPNVGGATPDPARMSSKKSRRVFGLKRQDGNVGEVRTPKKSNFKKGDLLLGQMPPVKRRVKKGLNLDVGVEVRMSPRSRKLTDAMESYQREREQRPPWTEIDLGAVRPRDCIGRSCKVFWPMDKKWYPAVIHEYQSTTRKYRIDYEDDEKEWLSLAKERVKLRLTPEEKKALLCPLKELVDTECSVLGDEVVSVSACGYEKLTAIASEIEDFEHREFQPGEVLWAKVKGYPMWPAYLMDDERSAECGLETSAKEGTLPLQFFGSYDYARVHAKHVVPFLRGLMSRYHTKCTRHAFVLGMGDVYRYFTSGGSVLPEKMEQLQDEVVIVSPQYVEEDQDFMEEERKTAVKKSPDSLFMCPLELGDLTVVDFGKVVRDSEHFHNEHYIWPEGYKAFRKFRSMKDPTVSVNYDMEVLRNPSVPLSPLFRLRTEDGSVVEKASASACWDTVFKKVRKNKAKPGSGGSPQIEEKRRKGPSLFGFSHPRISKIIQALPYARVCNKFSGWYEKPAEDAEELVPAGYKPVEVEWKHRDRCSVCYLDEEYLDNLLLQCDKCRMLVHMKCYGEVQAPDGDLWLCSLCGQDSPKKIPPCCICPVKGGAMKRTTDGRWAHIACVIWIPEAGLFDLTKLEKIDGVNRVDKERWKLNCSLCKVPYGACIQCSHIHCRTSYHPLCARAADFRMEVVEESMKSFCKKHWVPAGEREASQQQIGSHCLAQQDLPPNQAGCARLEPFNHAARRGRREPEALAAALAKRVSVKNMPYIVSGCRMNPPSSEQIAHSTSLWYRNWKPKKAAKQTDRQETVVLGASCDGEAVLSMSDRYRKMRSTVHERLTFGKSAIHGIGVFTKKSHRANEMVIEYAGEIVRQVIADIRERRCYDSLVGAGTYMFRIDNDRLVDATKAGTIAHLINHSCEPNCYSRVIVASGEEHIIIFSKEELPAGVELTYDYRFSSKDELLTCYCGKPGCRGSVNIADQNDEHPTVTVARSELVKWDPTSV